jgi:hypothetical protein
VTEPGILKVFRHLTGGKTMKGNKWEVWGWSPMLKKFTALAYVRTKKEAETLIRKWRGIGNTHPMMAQKRNASEVR